MKNIAIGLVALAVLGFIMAVVVTLATGSIAGVSAEGFSRASTNLALIAIALIVVFPDEKGDTAA